MLNPEQLPLLAGALLRLRGQTMSAVAQATGIRTANLSVWLRGKAQVISANRVTGLLHYQGIEGGRLRTDMLHRWVDHGSLDSLRTVYELLRMSDPEPIWLFEDHQPGLTKTRFLHWGKAWIQLALTPDATGTADPASITQAQRVLTLPTALGCIPTDSLTDASNALLELAEQMAVDVEDDELLNGLMHKLAEITVSELTFDTTTGTGWVQLESALRTALRRGIGPAEIAMLISRNYH